MVIKIKTLQLKKWLLVYWQNNTISCKKLIAFIVSNFLPFYRAFLISNAAHNKITSTGYIIRKSGLNSSIISISQVVINNCKSFCLFHLYILFCCGISVFFILNIVLEVRWNWCYLFDVLIIIVSIYETYYYVI